MRIKTEACNIAFDKYAHYVYNRNYLIFTNLPFHCAEDVWKKYKNLRNFFVREVKRTCEKRREVGDDTYTSKWVHFNRMRFLLTPLKLRISESHPDNFCKTVSKYYSFLIFIIFICKICGGEFT